MRVVILVVGALILAGCVAAVPIDGASYVVSNKGLVDHLVSLGSGKNCSRVRTEQGLTYCEEDEINVRPNVNCYRTLGRVTCYTKRDPFNTGQSIIGSNEHNSRK